MSSEELKKHVLRYVHKHFSGGGPPDHPPYLRGIPYPPDLPGYDLPPNVMLNPPLSIGRVWMNGAPCLAILLGQLFLRKLLYVGFGWVINCFQPCLLRQDIIQQMVVQVDKFTRCTGLPADLRSVPKNLNLLGVIW